MQVFVKAPAMQTKIFRMDPAVCTVFQRWLPADFASGCRLVFVLLVGMFRLFPATNFRQLFGPAPRFGSSTEPSYYTGEHFQIYPLQGRRDCDKGGLSFSHATSHGHHFLGSPILFQTKTQNFVSQGWVMAFAFHCAQISCFLFTFSFITWRFPPSLSPSLRQRPSLLRPPGVVARPRHDANSQATRARTRAPTTPLAPASVLPDGNRAVLHAVTIHTPLWERNFELFHFQDDFAKCLHQISGPSHSRPDSPNPRLSQNFPASLFLELRLILYQTAHSAMVSAGWKALASSRLNSCRLLAQKSRWEFCKSRISIIEHCTTRPWCTRFLWAEFFKARLG